MGAPTRWDDRVRIVEVGARGGLHNESVQVCAADRVTVINPHNAGVFAPAFETFSQKNVDGCIAESLECLRPALERLYTAESLIRGYVCCAFDLSPTIAADEFVASVVQRRNGSKVAQAHKAN